MDVLGGRHAKCDFDFGAACHFLDVLFLISHSLYDRGWHRNHLGHGRFHLKRPIVHFCS